MKTFSCSLVMLVASLWTIVPIVADDKTPGASAVERDAKP